MIQTAEQIIESVRALPLSEKEKFFDLAEEEKQKVLSEKEAKKAGLKAEQEKFRRAMNWLDENRQKYLGQWVCLDGDNLIAQSYAQTVIGYYIYPAGSLTARPNRAMTNAINDPLFIIGNGDHSTLPNPTRSNAFEVSYNGHSTVFDVNRTVRDPFYGATYTDNILYSWGRVSGATKNIVPNQEFGVVSVIPGAAIGVYKVSIRVLDPHTSAPVALTEGSVTATLVDDEGSEETPIVCGSITSSPITFAAGLNTFIVKTGSLGVGGTCAPEWRSFMFKVTGRPPVQ